MGKDLRGKELGKGIVQRKDGRYFARATIKGQTISIYHTNLKKLKEEFEDAKYKAMVQQVASVKKDLTFNEWFDEWYDKYKKPTLKKSSTYNYKSRVINLYGSRIGTKGLSEIKQLHLQTCVADLLEQGYSPKTIREATGVLQQCFDAAIANGMMLCNPCIGVLIPENAPVKKRVLTQKEQDVFLDFITNSHNWYDELYHVMFLTGMRVGEIAGLQDDDIDFVNKFIYVKHTLATVYVDGVKTEELTTPKTQHAYRAIPFFGETEKYLKLQIEKRDALKKRLGNRWRTKPEFGNLVFCTSMGSPANRYVVERDLNNVVKTYNKMAEVESRYTGEEPFYIEKMHPHCIRHTVATRLLEKNMNPRVVQEILGHANYNTTLQYSHALSDFTKTEAEKIGNLLTPKKCVNNTDAYKQLAGILK